MNTFIQMRISKYREKIYSYQKRHGLLKPQLIFQKLNDKIKNQHVRLQQATWNYIKTKTNDFNALNNKMQLLDPKSQFKRGFSIAMDTKQNIIFSPNQVNKDDVVRLQLSDGIVTTKVLDRETEDA